jgi:CHAT domain-containing protein
MQRGVGGITEGQEITYTLSDGKKIQKVTEVVTGTESVVRAVSFSIGKSSPITVRLTMKPGVLLVSFSLPLFGIGCSIPKYQPTTAAYRQAIVRGEIQEALVSYEAQAREAEKNAQESLFPQQYWRAGVAAYRLASAVARHAGQLQKAITYGEKALEMAEKSKDPGSLISAIHALALTYREVRNIDQARELTEKGVAVVKALPPNIYPRAIWESLLYELLGNDLIRERKYERAIDLLSLSVDRQQSYLATIRRNPVELYGARGGLLLRLTSLGNAYRRAGRLQESAEQYQLAFDYITEWGLKYPGEGTLYGNMGELLFEQKNFPEALENFQKVLALSESQQLAGQVRWATSRIGDILRQTGKPAEAVPYYEKAIQQIESARSLLESEEYRQSFFEGELRPYASMMRALLSEGKQEEAFNYSERARSRGFLDVLGSKVQLSRVKSGLLEEERTLQEQIAAIKARLSGEEEAETDRSGLRKQLVEADAAYSAFLTKVRKQDKEQASFMAVEPLTLTQVQELLDPRTTLIEYFITENEIFAWVVEKEKLQFQRIELPKDKLSGLVKTLRGSIFTLGEREKFNETSAVLYKQLIEFLLPHIAGKELIIVPHDVLHYLPFHALAGPDGHYLIEKYPIYYLSSASLLQFVKEKRKAGGEKVLAFGNPDLGDPEKNLEFAELEAKEVKAAYPESSVYIGKEATEEKSKTLSANHDILHFATHAKLNEDDPLSSAVLLAKENKEDGRLEVREIFGMELKAKLVVLSGCETGLGKLSTGDELVGLTRAFIYAGTPSVVASLWSVDDSSTAHLMASFYRNLKTMSKVEALRQAQLELIRGEGRSELLARRGVGGIGKLGETPKSESLSQSPTSISTSHPYFWAPFILVGDGK